MVVNERNARRRVWRSFCLFTAAASVRWGFDQAVVKLQPAARIIVAVPIRFNLKGAFGTRTVTDAPC